MSAALDKLVSIASAELARPPLPHAYGDLGVGELGRELLTLLAKKNGFYAFESALHVFPLGAHADPMNLEAWNAGALWRDHYVELADGYLFFAEDVFGDQFGIKDGEVWSFEAETGTPKAMATTLTDWAEAVLSDYNYWTGYPLAHEWQRQHGSLPPGTRLAPKVPFVAGGKYSVENLYRANADELMRFRGDLARQIKELPEGAKIRFRVVD